MKLESRDLRAFGLAPLVILMAMTLRSSVLVALQAAAGGFLLGVALTAYLARGNKR